VRVSYRWPKFGWVTRLLWPVRVLSASLYLVNDSVRFKRLLKAHCLIEAAALNDLCLFHTLYGFTYLFTLFPFVLMAPENR